MTSVRLAWRYLRGRGVRSLLTTLAVVFGVMLIFGLNGITPTLVEVFNRSLLATAGQVDLRVTSSFNQPFEVTVLQQVARTPGIASASPQVQRTVPLPSDPDRPLADQVTQLIMIGIDPASAAQIRDLTLVRGRALAVADADVAVLSADLAGRLGLNIGDRLTVPSVVGTTGLTVVGLLSTATVPGQETVYLPLSAAQRLFGFGGRITAVEAAFEPGTVRQVVEAAVRRAVGDGYDVGGLSTNSSLLASLQVGTFAFTMFGVFALATAGFIIMNSFRAVVAERRREIGMLRAIGARRATITRMFLVESLIQGIIGTGLGIAAGWGMATALFAFMSPLFERLLHQSLGDPVFAPSSWALAIGLGVGVTVAAALLPARAAGRVTPMEAMRPQVGESYQRKVGLRAWLGAAMLLLSVFALTTGISELVGWSAVVFLIGAALTAPAAVSPQADWFGAVIDLAFAREGAIARSNLQRNPGRSAITVTSVMLGLASIVAMLTVVTAVFAGFTSYITRSMSADYLVIPQSIILSQGNVAAGPRLASEVRRAEGIGAVSTLRLAQGRVGGAAVQVIGIDPVGYREVADFEWNNPSTDAALDQLGSGRWLIANGIYASQNGLRVGQQVDLDTPSGPRIYHVAGIGNDYLNAKLSTVYVSQANLARDFAVTADLLVMANRVPGADPTTVTAAMTGIVADYPAFRLYEAAQWRDEQLVTFDSTIIIFYSLIAALALPSLLALVNTLAISVLGRTREIGMLRAVGATRRQIRRMVIAESLLLSLIGTVFGVLAGLWLGYALVSAMSAIGWPMPYSFPWGGIALTAGVGMVFGLLAAFVPARSAARLDVVRALHHE
ncbi:MAG: FtsX-like permease family protein [Micropruina sp.]